ncbi:MAG: hypothetical protein RLY71_4491, partial [Pseudomonadota bacterium]
MMSSLRRPARVALAAVPAGTQCADTVFRSPGVAPDLSGWPVRLWLWLWQCLCGILLCALLALGGCASPAGAAQAHVGGGGSIEVAPGVHMLQGAAGEIDPANLGRVGNSG